MTGCPVALPSLSPISELSRQEEPRVFELKTWGLDSPLLRSEPWQGQCLATGERSEWRVRTTEDSTDAPILYYLIIENLTSHRSPEACSPFYDLTVRTCPQDFPVSFHRSPEARSPFYDLTVTPVLHTSLSHFHHADQEPEFSPGALRFSLNCQTQAPEAVRSCLPWEPATGGGAS